MNKKTAATFFVLVCLVLALLVVFRGISPVLVGGIFALILVVLGLVSRGFTRK